MWCLRRGEARDVTSIFFLCSAARKPAAETPLRLAGLRPNREFAGRRHIWKNWGQNFGLPFNQNVLIFFWGKGGGGRGYNEKGPRPLGSKRDKKKTGGFFVFFFFLFFFFFLLFLTIAPTRSFRGGQQGRN